MSTLQWAPTEKFEISGFELETMVQILSERLNTKEAQQIIRDYDTLRLLQETIKKGLKEGKVTEILEPGIKTDSNTDYFLAS